MEGQTCDPKTWKANFRCAMNSLPDITEMKKMSINKGHQAVRVFKMLPVTTKAKGKTGGQRILKTLPRRSQQGVNDFKSSPLFVRPRR